MRSWETSFLGDLGISTFIPIEALNRTDADVTLLFLINLAEYTDSVDDLFFHADVAVNNTGSYATSGGPYLYKSNLSVSVMGCTEQHQFCDTASGECTDLTGAAQLTARMFTGKKLSIVKHIWEAVVGNLLLDMVFSLG